MIGNTHGMALIVTLAMVSVILAGVLELNRLSVISAAQIHHQHEGFLAREKAMSGIHLGMAFLVRDAGNSELDSVQEDWACPDKLALAVEYMGFNPKDLVVHIEDERGKIQMNALIRRFPGHEVNPDQRAIWQRFLELNLSRGTARAVPDPEGIVNCAVDWLDSNDNDTVTGISGAETYDYLSGPVPYPCANAPFNHPFEFFSLRDVVPEMLDGGLLKVRAAFTVYGAGPDRTADSGVSFPGRININTAKEEVLAALLPGGKESRAADLVSFRKEQTTVGKSFVNTLDRGWYEKVLTLSDIEKKELERVICYSSDLFSILSTGRENKTMVRLLAVVKREKKEQWECRIIQLEREH